MARLAIVLFFVLSLSPVVALAEAPPSQGDSFPVAMSVVLEQYEAVRAALAGDNGRRVAAPARAIKRRIDQLGQSAPARHRANLTALGRAAERLAASHHDDLPGLRTRFGELSRPVVAILSTEPTLRRGLHVFECPMVEGFKKWVQRSPERSNPYMGQAMLRCGRASTF